jgi:hypothetical protein
MGRGFVHAWNENPAHFAGEIAGSILGHKAFGALGKLSPVKYGKFSFETGNFYNAPKYLDLVGPMTKKMEFATWRGVYYQTPRSIASHIWTGIPTTGE